MRNIVRSNMCRHFLRRNLPAPISHNMQFTFKPTRPQWTPGSSSDPCIIAEKGLIREPRGTAPRRHQAQRVEDFVCNNSRPTVTSMVIACDGSDAGRNSEALAPGPASLAPEVGAGASTASSAWFSFGRSDARAVYLAKSSKRLSGLSHALQLRQHKQQSLFLSFLCSFSTKRLFRNFSGPKWSSPKEQLGASISCSPPITILV